MCGSLILLSTIQKTEGVVFLNFLQYHQPKVVTKWNEHYGNENNGKIEKIKENKMYDLHWNCFFNEIRNWLYQFIL